MSDESEHLLYVLSARREIAWSSFKQTFEVLYRSANRFSESESNSPRLRRMDTMRAMDSLGHCNFNFCQNCSRVFVSPAALCRLPTAGLPKAVLSGARSPQTLVQVRDVCTKHGAKVDIVQQHKALQLVPSRMCVEAESSDTIGAVAESLGIRFAATPSSWALALISSSLEGLLNGLKWQPGEELTWVKRDFDLRALRFDFKRADDSNLRLTRYVNPTKGTYLHRLSRDGQYAMVDCDWGRYAVLAEHGRNVLFYDERQKALAVPNSVPLPKLLARSLALCSGYAPQTIPSAQLAWAGLETYAYDVFRWVPVQIAEIVANCVGQAIIPHPMEIQIE
jgi:hypothetical protein